MCRREPLPGMTLDETDELVSAVGGWRVDERYVLPLSAFDEAGGGKPTRDDGLDELLAARVALGRGLEREHVKQSRQLTEPPDLRLPLNQREAACGLFACFANRQDRPEAATVHERQPAQVER